MNKNIRDYIRRHGRTAARKQFGDSIDNIDIYFDGAQVGIVKRYWHPEYTCYVWEAVLTHEGTVYSHIDFHDSQVCVDWAHKTILELQKPKFNIILRATIQASCHSIQGIADIVGCSRFSIHKWIRGESYPDYHYLQAIAQILGAEDGETLFQRWAAQIATEQRIKG